MDYPYISVYLPNEKDFSHNGLRILCPKSCTITEVLNGEYSLKISHPLDEQGSWKFIRERYIIKAQGQLFRIYRKTVAMTSGGDYEITADALHVFYDLNFYFIRDTRVVIKDGSYALSWIMNNTETRRGSSEACQPSEEFSYSSDIYSSNPIENLSKYCHSAYYEKMSVTKALIGADNSFVTVWGGELYRDNFRFSINKRRGKDNAFSVRYGFDMTEIRNEVDYSDYCSSVYYEGIIKGDTDVTLNGTVSLNTLDSSVLPVPPMKSHRFELDIKDIKTQNTPPNPPSVIEMRKACEERAKEYILASCQPVFNYKVSFADLKRFDLYKDFIKLQECNIGDIGTICHEPLGISVTQQIVKKVVDGITGETISIELGSLRKGIVKNNVNGGTNSIRAELLKNEIAMQNTWENLGIRGFTMKSINVSWSELAGNPIISGGDNN